MESRYQKSREDVQTERDALDRTLDAALAKYSVVEPRGGIEQRILARLRSEQDRIPNRFWWQWSAVGAVTAVVVIAIAFAWKWSRPAKTVALHPSAAIEAVHSSSVQIVTNKQTRVLRPFAMRQTKATHRRVHQPVAVADEPKLDQFPSPRPLSEQEKLALEYVERFPEEASLMAQAQTNFARQLEMEERQGQTNSQ
jgi:hypothetical protein